MIESVKLAQVVWIGRVSIEKRSKPSPIVSLQLQKNVKSYDSTKNVPIARFSPPPSTESIIRYFITFSAACFGWVQFPLAPVISYLP